MLTGFECSNCGTKSVVRTRDFLFWPMISLGAGYTITILLCVIVKLIINYSVSPAVVSIIIVAAIFLAGIFYCTIGWSRVQLKIKK
jgi:hypothetical protein